MKISKSDYKYVPVNADPGFSEEHNRKVIEEVIKESEAYARKKRRDHNTEVDIRASAVAQYLKDVEMGGKETDVKKYFGDDQIAYLRGMEKMEKIRQIWIEKKVRYLRKMRKKYKARRRKYEPLSFKELCRIMEITPFERIQLIKSLKSRKAH